MRVRLLRRKGVAWVAAVVMLLGLLPTVSGLADTETSGELGNGILWSLDAEGVLTLSGEGAMEDFGSEGAYYEAAPWDPAQVKTAVVESGITHIGSKTFENCVNVTSVVLPDTVTQIGTEAFDGCVSLESIALPEGLTKLNDFAFTRCTGLTSMTLPNSITTLGEGVFYACTALETVTAPQKEEGFAIGTRVLDGTAWYNAQPEGALQLGSVTFGYKGTLPAELTIPAGTTLITPSAFADCTGITAVTLPAGLRTIGASAFAGCTGLTEITIPDGTQLIEGYAFNGCSNLTTVNAPDSLINVGSGAFKNTAWYSSQSNPICVGPVLIRGGVTTVPDGVKSIGDSAFYYSIGLLQVTLPESVTYIGENAFGECSQLTTINLPAGLTHIGKRAFYDCRVLDGITLPSGLISLGEQAFYGCKLTEITVPAGITDIPRSAFAQTGLEKVTLADGIASVGDSAFQSCTALTSITVPGSVKRIGKRAFAGCALTEAVLSEGVSTIGAGAFEGTALTAITFPASVTEIGSGVIDTTVETITFKGDAPSIDAYAFAVSLGEDYASVAATAYYPCGNATWTEEKRVDYGGVLLWEKQHSLDAETGLCTRCGPLSVEDYKENGTHPEKDGHVFAGWFEDEACSKPYKKNTGKAYPKFVNEKVLYVWAQAPRTGTVDDAKTDIRFVTTIDTLDYETIGFEFVISGKTTQITSKTVYRRISAGGASFTAEQVSGAEESNYLYNFTIRNIPKEAYNTDILVRAFWTTPDGTVVYSDQVSKTAYAALEAN